MAVLVGLQVQVVEVGECRGGKGACDDLGLGTPRRGELAQHLGGGRAVPAQYGPGVEQQVLRAGRDGAHPPGRGVGASVDGRDTRQLRLTSVVAGGTSVKRRLRVVKLSTPARSARVASSFRT